MSIYWSFMCLLASGRKCSPILTLSFPWICCCNYLQILGIFIKFMCRPVGITFYLWEMYLLLTGTQGASPSLLPFNPGQGWAIGQRGAGLMTIIQHDFTHCRCSTNRRVFILHYVKTAEFLIRNIGMSIAPAPLSRTRSATRVQLLRRQVCVCRQTINLRSFGRSFDTAVCPRPVDTPPIICGSSAEWRHIDPLESAPVPAGPPARRASCFKVQSTPTPCDSDSSGLQRESASSFWSWGLSSWRVPVATVGNW